MCYYYDYESEKSNKYKPPFGPVGSQNPKRSILSGFARFEAGYPGEI